MLSFFLLLFSPYFCRFIKSNTSTCNTPHKVNLNPFEIASDAVVVDEKKVNCNVGGGESSSLQQQQKQHGNMSMNNECGKNKKGFNKRQISRELFIVNQECNQCDKSDNDNNRVVGSSNNNNCSSNENKGGKFHSARTSGGGGRQNKRNISESPAAPIALSSSFAEIGSPNFGCDYPITHSTSTPSNNASFTTLRINRSIDDTITSTPNNSHPFNSKNSLSFDQSSQYNRGGNSTGRKSFDSSRNNSNSRRNVSSPFCLGDFINTSNASNASSGKKKRNVNNAIEVETTPKFSSFDFPTLQSNQSKMSNAMSDGKPKKRVAPITVSRKASTDTPNFISSSFQCENNLLNVTTLEADESSEAGAVDEREMLREHRDAISKDFNNEHKPIRNLHALIKENLPASPISSSSSAGAPATCGTGGIAPTTPHKSTLNYDELKVDRRDVLMVMAKLYSFLIDMNLVPNVLSELSYLVNLLNTEHNPYEHYNHQSQMKSCADIALNLLKNFHNCIFFAICVLNHQKQTLGMLDATTIRVLCEFERIQIITPTLYEYLRNIMQKKMQMDTIIAAQHKGRNNASINNVVFYQQETDNRDNFPSDREFGAFKKQRDLFYTILR